MRRDIRRALAFDRRVRFVAAQFHIATERDGGHTIVGCPVLSPKQARTDSDFEELGNDEMAKLMEDNRCAEDKNKGENSNYAAL